jgi:trehalose/maltose transport system substrate-binding protein
MPNILRTLLCAGALVTAATATQPATVAISCGAVGLELELCREGAEAWAAKTGNEVTVVSTPNSATERLALYQQILAANSSDIDVFQIDVIWPGILAIHFIDLSGYIPKEEIGQHFPAIVENDTVGGRFVAMPWFTDAGILYYRKDLLEKYGRVVPRTWQELEETARLIQE